MRPTLSACVLASALLLACGDNGTDESTDEVVGETEEPLQPICEVPLAERVRAEDIFVHLQALDQIAASNEGNRAAGSPGYAASVDYVEAQLQAAGYQVERWDFSFDRYVETQPTQLSLSGEQSGPWAALELRVDYGLANWSPSGQVAAPLQAVDLDLGLDNQSTSGCEAEDFAGFTAGNIALIQRGSCNFLVKAENAEAAGAVGVLLFNQGDRDDRMGLFNASLGSSNELSIPVLTATYEIGIAIADAGALEVVTAEIFVDAGPVATPTQNLIAETAGGDPNHVVMVGAHLDSVPAGPGINDNGSGTGLVLELARQLRDCSPRNKVRFAWWGGEEWGLQGSRAWVSARSEDELAALALYLNFDMVASPNYVRAIYDGVGGPAGSDAIYQAFLARFEEQALTTTTTPFAGNSDYAPFVEAGIPAGGLFTGAGASKSEDEATLFGGEAGVAADACYHQACDTQDNINTEVLGQNALAAASVLEQFAGDPSALAEAPDAALGSVPAFAEPEHACHLLVR